MVFFFIQTWFDFVPLKFIKLVKSKDALKKCIIDQGWTYAIDF